MKTLRILFVASFFICSSNVISQTPEQKKQAEEMQKNAEKMMKDMEKMQAQAQRQYDSIMNTQQMKDIEAKNKAMMEQMDRDREQRKAERAQSSVNPITPSVKHLVSKDSGTKFENWQFGEADVVLVGLNRYGRGADNIKVIGKIKANGSFTFDLPEKITTHSSVSDLRWVNCSRGSGSNQKWSGASAGALRPTVRIIQGGKELGTIFWASSPELIEGWTTTSDYHGIPGHRMELVYVNAASSSEAACTFTRAEGTENEYTLYKKINVEFKKGWNLIKTTFEGERIYRDWGGGENNKHNYYKDEKITAVQDLSADTKWIFYPN